MKTIYFLIGMIIVGVAVYFLFFRESEKKEVLGVLVKINPEAITKVSEYKRQKSMLKQDFLQKDLSLSLSFEKQRKDIYTKHDGEGTSAEILLALKCFDVRKRICSEYYTKDSILEVRFLEIHKK